MKRNARYTALEILETAGIENAIEKFGNFLINIGGIGGIVHAKKIIFVSNTETLDVFVGNENHVITLEVNEGEAFDSEAVKAVREEKKAPVEVKEEV